MYGNNDVCQRGQTSTVRGLAVTGAGDPLGIITKSHPTLDTQGFQRIQDYALQQQSAKLLHGKPVVVRQQLGVTLLYGNNDVCQRGQTSTVRGLAVTGAGDPLGIITKSHPTLDTQGFQRIQDYALQQQSAKLLHGKSRVCFCGKRKIDKNRNRSVVYNPNTERAYFENVQRCGSIWDCKVCAKRSLKHVEKN
ncbi:hypothetical protein AS579_19765 [Acinetobacter baumannii]|nr:hypothetical protein AS579_19765 [Acinetobacter baumannii]